MTGPVALEIDALQLGPIGTNCYVLRATGSSHAVVIDPGGDVEQLMALVTERDLTVDGILVTHCHWDHIGAVAPLAVATGAPVWMSAAEAIALEQPAQFAMASPIEIEPHTVDHRLEGGEQFELAGINFDVLSVPGHSPGHLAFLVPGVAGPMGDEVEMPPICFIGDVIFRGSIGRTDLPFADAATLEASHRMLMERLAPDTVLLSGHGEPTTMGIESMTNPFLLQLV